MKDALLNAIESSSNEDFDVLDVLYVVAKTYKDEQYLNDNTSDRANKNQENFKRHSNKRKRSKRSLYDYANNNSYQNYYNATNNGGYRESSTKSHNSIFDSYKNVFSTPKAQPRRANLFNVPVDDMFLGTFAIPTNQAIAVS